LTHADQLPASPAPRRNLQAAKVVTFVPKACNAAATDHHAMISAKPMRVPTRSISHPVTGCMNVYASRNAVRIDA
jgi:hypothetical protein